MKPVLNKIVDFHGWLSDKDFIWWPFSFLRPAKTEKIDLSKKLMMTLCFAGAGSLMLVTVALMNNAFDLISQLKTLAIIALAFFVWFSLVTAPLWNLRAERLSKK